MIKLSTFIKFYFPALAWAAVIFYFSNIPGLRYTAETAREIILRKGAHFVEYFILAVLIWRIFFSVHKFSAKKSFILVLFLSFLYAVSDELHQAFVFGRSGKVLDVLYDTISAFLGLEAALVLTLKKINRKIVFSFILAVSALIFLEYYMIVSAGEVKISEKPLIEISEKLSKPQEIIEKSAEIASDSQKNVLSKIFIKVPFTSQAPFANWDAYHEEACEEASLIMLKYYLDGKKLDPDTAEREIQNLIAYQIKNYGNFEDTNAQETKQLAKDYYGIGNLKVIYDFSKDDIKKYLLLGKPIIIPAAGQMLGNPYFSGDGPPYHMLVLVGYEKSIIITNDPGTKRGEGFQYDIDVLYGAIHDFTGNLDTIRTGRKAMIVLE